MKDEHVGADIELKPDTSDQLSRGTASDAFPSLTTSEIVKHDVTVIKEECIDIKEESCVLGDTLTDSDTLTVKVTSKLGWMLAPTTLTTKLRLTRIAPLRNNSSLNLSPQPQASDSSASQSTAGPHLPEPMKSVAAASGISQSYSTVDGSSKDSKDIRSSIGKFVTEKSKHSKTTHTDQSLLVLDSANKLHCSTCDRKFKLAIYLETHICKSAGVRQYKCPHCPCILRAGILSHISGHTGETPFKCIICGLGFPGMYQLKDHMTSHTGPKPIECGFCSCTFTHPSHLRVHRVKFHQGRKPYPANYRPKQAQRPLLCRLKTETPVDCELCHATLGSMRNLKNHMLTHTEERPFKCSHCPLSFAQKRNLTYHEVKHFGKRSFKCSRCPTMFLRSSGLASHMRNVHTPHSEKPYRCAECLYAATKKHTLIIHVRTHFPENSNRKLKYSCNICGIRSSNKVTLSNHVRGHSYTDTYVCRYCPTRFKKKDNLLKHARLVHRSNTSSKQPVS